MKYFSTALLLLLVVGCESDISIVDKKQTRVIVDSFIQPEAIEELDVLVSLDTSGSMSDNYSDVSDGMELLRSDIEGLTLDYQFGYITMDPTNLGFTGPYDATSSAIDMLMAPSLLPSTGLEEGFSATYTFLNSEEGRSFRREEADFLLFLISDEDEQSAISSELFYEWMLSQHEHVQHDVVCVVNPDDGQESHWAYDVGYKYIDLAALYGKGIIDITSEDWSIWLSQSSYLTTNKNYIALSEKDPIEDSIVVYIDNQIVYDWEYILDSNSVILGFVPSNGSLVEVGYNIYI